MSRARGRERTLALLEREAGKWMMRCRIVNVRYLWQEECECARRCSIFGSRQDGGDAPPCCCYLQSLILSSVLFLLAYWRRTRSSVRPGIEAETEGGGGLTGGDLVALWTKTLRRPGRQISRSHQSVGPAARSASVPSFNLVLQSAPRLRPTCVRLQIATAHSRQNDKNVKNVLCAVGHGGLLKLYM